MNCIRSFQILLICLGSVTLWGQEDCDDALNAIVFFNQGLTAPGTITKENYKISTLAKVGALKKDLFVKPYQGTSEEMIKYANDSDLNEKYLWCVELAEFPPRSFDGESYIGVESNNFKKATIIDLANPPGFGADITKIYLIANKYVISRKPNNCFIVFIASRYFNVNHEELLDSIRKIRNKKHIPWVVYFESKSPKNKDFCLLIDYNENKVVGEFTAPVTH